MKWIVLILTLVFALGGFARAEEAEGATAVPKDDPAMLAAFAKARQSLDAFISRLLANKDDSYNVKVKITDKGEVEYFWLGEVTYDGSVFHGTIDNEPEHVHNVKDGQKYDVNKADVYDWLYMKDGKMYGNFTLRAMLPRLSPEEAAKMRALLAN